ncbi:uncharacterized protein [Venturia canescens]|uniref:uncharacterized protein n=1 Tax=Venturia canescens TaxID=32260 RepID=UPI001C9D5185|nr:uncharacterized protein LOC122410474 [Venturia canescens]
MWLHPRDSLLASTETPVYFARLKRRKPGGVAYFLQTNAMANVGRLFENPEYYASLVIGSDPYTNEAVITGKFKLSGEKATVIIRPVPVEIPNNHLRKRHLIHNFGNKFFYKTRHVALKVADNFPENDWLTHLDILTSNDNKITGNKNYNNHDLSNPVKSVGYDFQNYENTIYPKIFLHYDCTYFRKPFRDRHRRLFDTTRFLEYVLAFWNGVDLSYRHLKSPSIRLHIAGIAIATKCRATPYIEKHTIKKRHKRNKLQMKFHRDSFKANRAWLDAKQYFYEIRKQIPFDMYDIAVTVTMLKMNSPEIGFATEGGACVIDEDAKEQTGVAVIQDNGAFSGIDTAAHEIAHTFGIKHDDGKKNAKCKEDFGYIMTPDTINTRNSSTFSPCSRKIFNKKLRSGSLKCMYNPPAWRANLPKLMPGRMKTLKEQCQAHGYLGICPASELNHCTEMWCLISQKRNCSTRKVDNICKRMDHGAAPGSTCRKGLDTGFCLSKECVLMDERDEENEEI